MQTCVHAGANISMVAHHVQAARRGCQLPMVADYDTRKTGWLTEHSHHMAAQRGSQEQEACVSTGSSR